MEYIKVGLFLVKYNGGEQLVRLANTSSITFLGVNKTTGALPLSFIHQAAKCGAVVMVCNTHDSRPALITSGKSNDVDDLLTKQILFREDGKRCAYIARMLVKRCFEGRQALAAMPDAIEVKLGSAKTVKDVIAIEAQASRDYWKRYYTKLELPQLHRRGDNQHPVNAALNALSRYESGIVLRWLLVHGFSPSHGFLHSQTRYEGLLYDLMEPYRYISEMAVRDTWQQLSETGENKVNTEQFINACTERYKSLLNEKVFVEPTKQVVYRKAMLHGVVIALRHYLSGKMRRFLPPIEVSERRGRPFVVSYTLPGEIK